MSESLPSISPSEIYRPVEVFVAHPPKRRPTWLYVLFFLLTILTTTVVGARMEFNFRHNLAPLALSDETLSFFPLPWILSNPSHLLLGIPFSATLMFILFSHEMGHYLYCRYYGVDATLPFFVPFPSLIGTMGAFIRIKSPIRSRSALFDIGIAGPIAGFVPACIALAAGLRLSKVVPASVLAPPPDVGFPLIFHMMNRLLHGSDAVSLHRLYLHPVAIAAWVGMFATALNLLPGGQLDGGHIVFSVSPRCHQTISTLTILVLIPLSLYRWTGWLVWAVVLRITGMRHPIVPEFPEITRARRWMAVCAAIMLLLTFTPTPITNGSLLQVIRDFRGGN
jgi:membrane-associated protease RseP (regulator of RpoE activity)